MRRLQGATGLTAPGERSDRRRLAGGRRNHGSCEWNREREGASSTGCAFHAERSLVLARYPSSDGEPQACSLAVARLVEPVKGIEDSLLVSRRNARTLI